MPYAMIPDATRKELTPEQKAYQQSLSEYYASKEFYEKLGYPQYAGRYKAFDVPAGYKVESITETAEGLNVIFQVPATAPTEPKKVEPSPSVGAIPPAPPTSLPDWKKIFFRDAISIEPTSDVFRDVQKARENPLGYYGGKVLQDVGLLSMVVAPEVAIPSALLGAGISDVFSRGLTGQGLSPRELTEAGLQSAAFAGISSAVLKGASVAVKAADKSLIAAGMRREIVPAFKDILGGSVAEATGLTRSALWVGMRTEIAPVFKEAAKAAAPVIGKTGVMAGIGGASGYILSGGQPEEAARSALVAGVLSLGLKGLTRGYRYVKSRVPVGREPALYQKPEGISKTPLEFDYPEEDVYKGLPSSMVEDLKRMKAQQDPLYKALFPKDAAVEAESRWGSVRKVPEPELPSASDLSDDLYKFLFPERAEEAARVAAEHRLGSFSEVPLPKEVKSPAGVTREGVLKWEIRAAKFEAQRMADPLGLKMLTQTSAKSLAEVERSLVPDIGVPELDAARDLDLRIRKWTVKAAAFEAKKAVDPLGLKALTSTSAKPLETVMKDWDIYDVAKVPEIFPEKDLTVRQQKWIVRAIKSDLAYRQFLGQTIPELPKEIGEYIKPIKKPVKIQPVDVAKEVTSAGQTLVQIQKPALAPVKEAVKQTTKVVQMQVSTAVLPKAPKVKPKIAAQEAAKTTMKQVAVLIQLPKSGQEPSQKQRAAQASAVSEIVGVSPAQVAESGVAPSILPKLAPKQVPKQQPEEMPEQGSPIIPKNLLLQVQQQIQEVKPYRKPKKSSKAAEIWAAQMKRRIPLAHLRLLGGIPRPKRHHGVSNIILGKTVKRKIRRRRKR